MILKRVGNAMSKQVSWQILGINEKIIRDKIMLATGIYFDGYLSEIRFFLWAS
jgi:hypothetical protein